MTLTRPEPGGYLTSEQRAGPPRNSTHELPQPSLVNPVPSSPRGNGGRGRGGRGEPPVAGAGPGQRVHTSEQLLPSADDRPHSSVKMVVVHPRHPSRCGPQARLRTFTSTPAPTAVAKSAHARAPLHHQGQGAGALCHQGRGAGALHHPDRGAGATSPARGRRDSPGGCGGGTGRCSPATGSGSCRPRPDTSSRSHPGSTPNCRAGAGCLR